MALAAEESEEAETVFTVLWRGAKEKLLDFRHLYFLCWIFHFLCSLAMLTLSPTLSPSFSLPLALCLFVQFLCLSVDILLGFRLHLHSSSIRSVVHSLRAVSLSSFLFGLPALRGKH